MSRVGIVGVGAIGGYAAASLADAGHEVVLRSRRGFDRLVVEVHDGELVVEQPAVTDPASVEPVEWVLVATKVQQNPACERWLGALCDADTTRAVVTLQNGVEGHEALAAPVPVVPSVVLFGAEQVTPGHIRHHGASELVVPVAWQASLGDLFSESRITVTGADDFATEAWRKLVMNAMSGPLCALTLRRLEVFHDRSIAALAVAVGTEAVAVANAMGASLDDSAPDALLGVLRAQPPTMGGSMLYDRLAGRRTEHDAILGPIVRSGRAHGLATPRCETLLALLDGIR